MKKKIVWIINFVFLIIIIVSSVFYIRAHAESKKRIAEENYNKWEMLYKMTKTVDEQFVKDSDWKQNDKLNLYVNDIISLGIESIEPEIRGVSSETWRFLSIRYLAHFIELAGNYIPDVCKEEAFQIFSDMNKELHEISSLVVESVMDEAGTKDADVMLDLIDEKSELYRELKDDITNFCEKYENQLNTFYVKIKYPKE